MVFNIGSIYVLLALPNANKRKLETIFNPSIP